MDLDLLLTTITIVSSLALGILVYFRGNKQLNNKVFLFLCLVITLWALVNYFSLHPVFADELFWIRLVLFFAALLMFSFFLFVYIFPQNKIKISKMKFYILTAISVLVSILTLTPYVFTGLETENNEIIPISGFLMPIFGVTIFIFLFLGIYRIFKDYRLSKGIEKLQWKFILFGFFIMLSLLIITQFILTVFFQNTSFINFGPLFTLPFIISSTYAIIKHNLLNIKVIATEFLTGFILFILFIKLFLSTSFQDFILNIIIFAVMTFFGILLIRAVIKEIKDKEQMQKMAVELKKANIELKRLDRAKSEFISIASHQLRTPLSSVKGYISMILEGTYGEIGAKIKEILSKVYQSNETLISLVNDLLNISRIERGKIEYNFQKTDLFKITSEVIGELNLGAEKKNLKINLFGEQNEFYINADSEKITQVALNLVDNAIKYTQKGEINIKLEQKENNVLLSVSDTGIGMAKEEIRNLFKKFSRGKEITKTNTGGTGLGLYIAYKIVEAHKGKIWAESKGRGMGSVFYVSLPMWK